MMIKLKYHISNLDNMGMVATNSSPFCMLPVTDVTESVGEKFLHDRSVNKKINKIYKRALRIAYKDSFQISKNY